MTYSSDPTVQELSEIVQLFVRRIEEQHEDSSAVSAILVLVDFLKNCEATTFMETKHQLKLKAKELIGYASSQYLSTASGCQLFLAFVADFDKDQILTDVDDWKRGIISRGEIFAENAKNSRQKAIKVGERFIKDEAVILTYGYSRTLLALLVMASKKKKFSLIVSEGRPECLGYKFAEEISTYEIPVTVIHDNVIGRVIEKVNFVIVGAEAITESGGIINKVGTYPLALSAKTAQKPFYVIAESFKFSRLYPLRQEDLPTSFLEDAVFTNLPENVSLPNNPYIKYFNPLFDYTPPALIELLFTDIGVLTPSAVGDELIKLFQF